MVSTTTLKDGRRPPIWRTNSLPVNEYVKKFDAAAENDPDKSEDRELAKQQLRRMINEHKLRMKQLKQRSKDEIAPSELDTNKTQEHIVDTTLKDSSNNDSKSVKKRKKLVKKKRKEEEKVSSINKNDEIVKCKKFSLPLLIDRQNTMNMKLKLVEELSNCVHDNGNKENVYSNQKIAKVDVSKFERKNEDLAMSRVDKMRNQGAFPSGSSIKDIKARLSLSDDIEFRSLEGLPERQAVEATEIAIEKEDLDSNIIDIVDNIIDGGIETELNRTPSVDSLDKLLREIEDEITLSNNEKETANFFASHIDNFHLDNITTRSNKKRSKEKLTNKTKRSTSLKVSSTNQFSNALEVKEVKKTFESLVQRRTDPCIDNERRKSSTTTNKLGADILNKFDDPELAAKLKQLRKEEREKKRQERVLEIQQAEEKIGNSETKLGKIESHSIESGRSETELDQQNSSKLLESMIEFERQRAENKNELNSQKKSKRLRREPRLSSRQVLERIEHLFDDESNSHNGVGEKLDSTATVHNISAIRKSLIRKHERTSDSANKITRGGIKMKQKNVFAEDYEMRDKLKDLPKPLVRNTHKTPRLNVDRFHLRNEFPSANKPRDVNKPQEATKFVSGDNVTCHSNRGEFDDTPAQPCIEFLKRRCDEREKEFSKFLVEFGLMESKHYEDMNPCFHEHGTSSDDIIEKVCVDVSRKKKPNSVELLKKIRRRKKQRGGKCVRGIKSKFESKTLDQPTSLQSPSSVDKLRNSQSDSFRSEELQGAKNSVETPANVRRTSAGITSKFIQNVTTNVHNRQTVGSEKQSNTGDLRSYRESVNMLERLLNPRSSDHHTDEAKLKNAEIQSELDVVRSCRDRLRRQRNFTVRPSLMTSKGRRYVMSVRSSRLSNIEEVRGHDSNLMSSSDDTDQEESRMHEDTKALLRKAIERFANKKISHNDDKTSNIDRNVFDTFKKNLRKHFSAVESVNPNEINVDCDEIKRTR